jgi:hypothetical protein
VRPTADILHSSHGGRLEATEQDRLDNYYYNNLFNHNSTWLCSNNSAANRVVRVSVIPVGIIVFSSDHLSSLVLCVDVEAGVKFCSICARGRNGIASHNG